MSSGATGMSLSRYACRVSLCFVEMEVTSAGLQALVALVVQKFEVQAGLATSLGAGPGSSIGH